MGTQSIPAADVVSIGPAELVVLDGDVVTKSISPCSMASHDRHRPVLGALGELGTLNAPRRERLGGAVRGVKLEPHLLL
jgi:hypothetical protein